MQTSPIVTDAPGEAVTYLDAAALQRRYRCSDMTIWRWLRHPTMEFPRPIRPHSRRRLWRLDEIEAWEKARADAPQPAAPPAGTGTEGA
jgi:predicted DNA-binding transcriptional regulator AlpA